MTARQNFIPTIQPWFPDRVLESPLALARVGRAIRCNRAWLLGPEDSEPVFDALYRLVASRFPYRSLRH